MSNRLCVILSLSLLLAASATAAGSAPPNAEGAADSATAAASSDGFVPLEPGARPTVNGAHLAIAAYAVILCTLLAYALALFLRERSVARAATELERLLQDDTPGITR